MSLHPAVKPCDLEPAWGDRVLPDVPGFDLHRQSPQSAAGQVGPYVDRLAEIPLSDHKTLLVMRHLRVEEEAMFPRDEYDRATRARIMIASEGLSILTARREGSEWAKVHPRKAPYNRRITGSTTCKVTGPLAGKRPLRTSADPNGSRILGVIGLTPGGLTPWTTVLAGERLLDVPESWGRVDPRFEPTTQPHESHRFGWMVEVDPLRPHARPRKLTMLGRMDHLASSVRLHESGHVLVAMTTTSGQRFQYVSKHRFDDSVGPLAAAYNRKLLAVGSVFVEISGDWVELTDHKKSLVPGWSVAEVLLDLEGAAAALITPVRTTA